MSEPAPLVRSGAAWRIAELRAAMALDRDRPEVLQYRRIVAETDGQTAFDLAITVASPAGLEVDLFHGGTLVERGMAASDRFGFSLTSAQTAGQR